MRRMTGAGGLAHDLLDQAECVFGALPESDERDVRSFPGCNGANVVHLDLPRNHLVTQCRNDGCDERQAILSLVGDQYAQVLGFTVTHVRPSSI
jgi:hypothetical protein